MKPDKRPAKSKVKVKAETAPEADLPEIDYPPKSTTGTLFVVATPIGNTMDWTERAKDILSKVDIVAAEPLGAVHA